MRTDHMGSPSRRSGFTLIELLVVMGIVVLMVTLALVSVASMLRSSRMSRAVGLIVAAADEARTAAITIRRSTKVDLTRIDAEGRFNRLTVVGPFFNENFESYPVYVAPTIPPNGPATQNWVTSGGVPYVESDGTRCLTVLDGIAYWNVGGRIDTVSQGDYELNVQARVKILPFGGAGGGDREIAIYAAIKDGGASVTDAYRLRLTVTPAAVATAPGRNAKSLVTLDRKSGAISNAVTGATGPAVTDVKVDDQATGNPTATTALVPGVWYRVSLSVKRISDPDPSNPPRAIVAGKVWADGQLEPWSWTVGPLQDNSPLPNGTGGFEARGCNARVDDVLFDVRPIRNIPEGLRVDALRAQPSTDPTVAGNYQLAPPDSNFNFPILFRPDGTSAERYVIRITDTTTGDKRYVSIDQNTGRARLEHSLQDAVAK